MNDVDRGPTSGDHRLRIAYMLPVLEVGGLQRATATIAKHLDRGRADAEVIVLRRPAQVPTVMYDELADAGVTVHDLHLTGRAERDPRALVSAVAKVRRLLIARKYDIVDSAVLEADLVSRLASVGVDVRQVTHLINLTHDARALHRERARQSWRPTAARWVDRASGHLTVRFVAITHAVSRSAQQTLGIPPEKIVVIERGVDVDRFQVQPLDRSPVLRVLSVGRLEPQKDRATAVRSIAELRDRGVECTLTIVGRGALQSEVEQVVSDHDLGDRVRIIEPVPDVWNLYASHDVLLFPSRWEGLGNAAIEAMACGRPVVATDLDVLREVLGPRGLYAPAGDAARFADQLERVGTMSVDERAQLSQALRQRVKDHFDPAETTDRLLQTYEDIVKTGRR